MNLNNKTLRQLRRAPRTRATELVKFRKEIIDGGLRDHWRWKSWVNHAPAAVYLLLQAAEVLDDVIRRTAPMQTVSLTPPSTGIRVSGGIVCKSAVSLHAPRRCNDHAA